MQADSPPSGLREFWSGVLATGVALAYYTGPGCRLVDLPGLARMRIDLTAGQADLLARPGAEAALEDGCLIPLLCEFLGACEQFVLHAACLSAGPRNGSAAVLLAGASGRGKTTAALALGHDGMRLLTDDATFIRDHQAHGDPVLSAWGLPRPCKVLEDTFRLLPWLMESPNRRGHAGGPLPLPRPSAGAEREWSVAIAPAAGAPGRVIPRAILFLEPPNPRGHHIEPLDKVAALTILTRENVRAFETRGSSTGGRAFKAFGRLVRQCRTYRLSAGPRMDQLHGVVSGLLERGG